MMSNNKKIVALLAAVGLAGFALLFFPGQSSSDVPGNPSSDTKHSLFANDPNFGGPSTESGGSKALFSRVMFAVLLVAVTLDGISTPTATLVMMTMSVTCKQTIVTRTA